MEDDKIKIFVFSLFMYLKFIIFNPQLLYFVAYFIIAIFGLFNPICTSLLLLDIFRRYPILLSIVDSLWRPRKSIFLTLLLFLLMTYYFALIFFYYFYLDLAPNCNDLWNCFAIMIDLTFKSNGGFLGFFQPGYRNSWKFSWRIIYDFFYIFIIIVLVS